MGKVAILAGDIGIGHSFAHDMMTYYNNQVAFIETIPFNHFTKTRAKERGIQYFEYVDEETTIRRIGRTGADLVVLAWWPHIVKAMQKLNGLTVINTHPSYLPYNRGKYPFYWAIMDGTPFGATIHRVDDGVDTGSILWRKQVELLPTDTGQRAWMKSRQALLDLLTEHAKEIAYGNLPEATLQEEGTAHHSRDFELPPILQDELYDGYTLIQDCRARTFKNKRSGRRIKIDGKMYRIHLQLVEEE